MRATHIATAGTWDATEAADRVLIDFDRRHRRRIALRTEKGTTLLLDLPQAARLRDGDGLVLESGAIVAVAARAESLAEISAASTATLVRIAWHLGNRHLPVQLIDGALRIRQDHVIEAMVAGLGGIVIRLDAPFDPEGGAYAEAGHGHHHHDDHHHHHHDDDEGESGSGSDSGADHD